MKPQPQVPPQQQTPQSNKFFAKFRNPKTMGTLYVSAVVSFICFLYITTVLLAWIIKMPCKCFPVQAFTHKIVFSSEFRQSNLFDSSTYFIIIVYMVIF